MGRQADQQKNITELPAQKHGGWQQACLPGKTKHNTYLDIFGTNITIIFLLVLSTKFVWSIWTRVSFFLVSLTCPRLPNSEDVFTHHSYKWFPLYSSQLDCGKHNAVWRLPGSHLCNISVFCFKRSRSFSSCSCQANRSSTPSNQSIAKKSATCLSNVQRLRTGHRKAHR